MAPVLGVARWLLTYRAGDGQLGSGQACWAGVLAPAWPVCHVVAQRMPMHFWGLCCWLLIPAWYMAWCFSNGRSVCACTWDILRCGMHVCLIACLM